MSSVNYGPVNDAEALIHNVFTQLEHEADPRMAQLRYENQLRRFVAESRKSGAGSNSRVGLQTRRRGPLMRPAFKLMAVAAALFLMASAANFEIPGWDDGQQITLAVPGGFEQEGYNHWVALFANRSKSLMEHGGHSLIVDYVADEDGSYMLELSILGVDCSTANTWVREVLGSSPELAGANYAITQPQVSYSVTVKEMLAYELGQTDSVERRVLRAWSLLGEPPTSSGVIYLIAEQDQYPRRTSMLR